LAGRKVEGDEVKAGAAHSDDGELLASPAQNPHGKITRLRPWRFGAETGDAEPGENGTDKRAPMHVQTPQADVRAARDNSKRAGVE
jgi:hypothetical protein